MADGKLDLLDDRLQRVEKLVFGQAEKDADYPKIVDALHAITTQITAATAGHPNIETVFKRVGEIEQCLDSQYIDNLSTSSSAKVDVILSEEAAIRENARLLEKVESANVVLSSEHIRAVPTLQNRLYSMCKIHLRQQDEAAELTDETKRLIAHYNNIITILSKQFIQWDELVTQLEVAQKVQTSDD